MHIDSIKCGKCGSGLSESPTLPATERPPCPNCGSSSRVHFGHVDEKVEVHEKYSMIARRKGFKRPIFEQVSGDDFHRKSGRWMILHRLIDRINDWYHEIVKDPKSGDIVHETSEPLSQHRGYGADKKNHSDDTK